MKKENIGNVNGDNISFLYGKIILFENSAKKPCLYQHICLTVY